jgi:hypothetical protein
MSQTKEIPPRFRQIRGKLILSLVINGLLPLVLYALLRPLLASDAYALAIAGAIPAVRTMALWIGRRRIDWIGAYAVLGFAIALAVTVFLAGNAFLLKVHGSLLTGTIGLVLLISVAVRKPLLEPLFQAFTRGAKGSRILEREAIDSASRQRIAQRIPIMTTVIGLAFFGDALAHVILALTLPTATFLVLSRLATIVILGGGVASLSWMRRHNTSLTGS